MKTSPVLLAVALAFLGLAAAASAQDIKFNVPGGQPAAGPAARAAAGSFTPTQMAEEVGWTMAKQSGIVELGFSEAEVAAFTKGFNAALAGQDSPYDLKTIIPEVTAYMGKKRTTYLQQLRAQNVALSDQFFAKLKSSGKVTVLPSGLCYWVVSPGDGPYPTSGQIVRVNYTGYFLDMKVFDSSVKHGQPAEFQLDQVIPGWTEGIQKINRGGKIRLFIPPNLAYGDEGNRDIPPGAALIFDVELLDIKPGAPAAAAPAAGSP